MPTSKYPVAPHDSTKLGMNLKGRLFVGFSEPAKQLEVISFNEKIGRFEFQVVRNYGEPTQEVLYARRGVCMVCHQAQAPIFPRREWAETNANLAVKFFLKQELNNAATYQGFPIANDERASAYANIKFPDYESLLNNFPVLYSFVDSRTRNYEIDRLVKLAHELNYFKESWTYGCGLDEKGNECRKTLIAATLDLVPDELRAEVSSYRRLVSDRIFSDKSSRYPGGLILPQQGLSSLENTLMDETTKTNDSQKYLAELGRDKVKANKLRTLIETFNSSVESGSSLATF